MTEYTYADVIIDPDDPRVEVGKEYYFGTTPKQALEFANANGRGAVLIKVDTSRDGYLFCFENFTEFAPCIIRKKEPEKKYVPFDLSDQDQIRELYFCWLIHKDSGNYYSVTAIYPEEGYIHIAAYGDVSPLELLDRFKFMHNDSPCGKLVEEEDGED